MAKTEIKQVMDIQKIGPHSSLHFEGISSSLKTAIYANNGSGKTFLSRIFRILEDMRIEYTDKLISFGENKSHFEYIINDGIDTRKLTIDLNRGASAICNNETGYIFHTFNSDYVRDNIEALRYKPSGEIEGYILGKEVIDLTKEKNELLIKEAAFELGKEQAIQRIDVHCKELTKPEFGIRSNTSEFQNFTFKNIYNLLTFDYSEEKTFEELKKENTKLNTLPDDYQDIQLLRFSSSIDIDFLEDIQSILDEEYSKSHFAEEFKSKIKNKQLFVEEGLKHVNGATCPFCETPFDEKALSVIDQYTLYLDDQEAKIISKIDSLILAIAKLFELFSNKQKNSFKVLADFERLKQYLPSFAEKSLIHLEDSKEIIEEIEKIQILLSTKKQTIDQKYQCDIEVERIISFIDQNTKISEDNDNLIQAINTQKNNLSKEKLAIKKRLCIAKYLHVLHSEKVAIEVLKQQQEEINILKHDILGKELRAKESKKDKVAEAFKENLDTFFSGKYEFDKDSFCLKFKTYNLIENASDVLSDGEKSIVSFCYFLADTHNKVSTQDDYKKLFFIIDDPISSMDFHYVYSIAQRVRYLNEVFSVERVRFLILTHNLEFMSILIRNNIIENNAKYIIEAKQIKKLKDELIMPYEEHLRDVYDVALGKVEPTHTTPNSIRNILETINKFEMPDKDFKIYCESVGIFENAYLYSLIHDNSHGSYRSNSAYTPEMLINGCQKVIEIISAKFSGQIKLMERRD
ncbi:hypothetical protein SMGD1_2030 [Sulfurimonas gotlandica GD1]|uniref:Protein CR006 P-loop domain-containing protein n=1 Tax=Sulfurimonas gotlandica (strain DSM 19862 / JCM 16533 / GD1) TaxID=929558 RepID=B6BJ38_SULGG|nr:AAA family ATPase [Sulfurimonas gotlandica]EDZ63538.1 conserved hypothetical protein [Sulfurimonas gotlandica GD1]EHP30553.1 hypothetical protein SMGD1_2030 [Sulfurimonas gotlandica GD1]